MPPRDDDDETREAYPVALRPAATVSANTLAWLEHAVIGLNLCPFAKAPWSKGQVRCVVSASRDPGTLLAELADELNLLVETDPQQIETTLLVVPDQFVEFEDFNDFLDAADAALAALDLEGTIQIASFHPRYRFAGTAPDDLDNATNRAPYPTLHLLREDSVARAVGAIPDPSAIYEANIRTLRELGEPGWEALRKRFEGDGGC
ncbi:MAG TPA: DUF1415 domain-containing protein [Burkholderiaceae bacterium]|nr:DUF1415 domain-containing protein [Burkholderiaceae bacterium]